MANEDDKQMKKSTDKKADNKEVKKVKYAESLQGDVKKDMQKNSRLLIILTHMKFIEVTGTLTLPEAKWMLLSSQELLILIL